MAGMEMAMRPTVADALVYVTAWSVMMTAMMLPSALPMIDLYAATQRNVRVGLRAIRVGSFTLMYLGLWTLTGLPVYFTSVALSAVSRRSLVYVVAAVLIFAGVFQLSPFKRVCLRHCRSPLGFLFGHWREGWQGGLAMGRAHAVYCLGCCWALMVVLVVAGAMGLVWVLLIAAIVAAEKLLPRGEWIARVTGIALVLLGVAVAVRPGFANLLRAGTRSM
jgi:predicted metal-binding membrane protein